MSSSWQSRIPRPLAVMTKACKPSLGWQASELVGQLQATARLRGAAGLNAADVDAAMSKDSPVCGLRPVRAARSRVSNRPEAGQNDLVVGDGLGGEGVKDCVQRGCRVGLGGGCLRTGFAQG